MSLDGAQRIMFQVSRKIQIIFSPGPLCYDRNRPMNQASRIIARIAGSGESDVFSTERVACGCWKKAVGKRLADKTRAAKLVRNTLVVEVEDDVWRRQLWALRWHILRNVEKAIGPDIVKELEFRVMPPRREPQRESRTAMPLFDPRADEADGIEDPMLRRIYRNARRRETA